MVYSTENRGTEETNTRDNDHSRAGNTGNEVNAESEGIDDPPGGKKKKKKKKSKNGKTSEITSPSSTGPSLPVGERE
jgi:hypothetical protein